MGLQWLLAGSLSVVEYCLSKGSSTSLIPVSPCGGSPLLIVLFSVSALPVAMSVGSSHGCFPYSTRLLYEYDIMATSICRSIFACFFTVLVVLLMDVEFQTLQTDM